MRHSLTERDLETIGSVTGDAPAELRARLTTKPWSAADLLTRDDVVDAVLSRGAHPSVAVSPFLLFSVIAHCTAEELRTADHLAEWCGPGARIPVFDIDGVHEFLSAPGRVDFLAGLLVSFVSPAPALPGVDPLDMVDMALWVDSVLPEQKSALLRRLGDLALFLSGVFPDAHGPTAFGPLDAELLGSTVGMTAPEILALCAVDSIGPGLKALEVLGAAWYSAACGDGPAVLGDVASRFDSARRVLTAVSDRHLHHIEPGLGLAA